ncbi:sigma 54-interacting transcriptional regulator [Clostridium sp. D2Q-14]|uniref:sigma-54 interaction domain-containing protein n=1 Tax=Anaeromonas gelatinilytica TaxID=2683194 RepID=UPI00193B672D|nr:sigma 54-interacting transcriptional regulator [Anaeromonas gelatinilytica]MBS4535911.1 sigma 54-interacting transcriptional regulator [Anaeromonas gelatinilytica]
MIIDNWVKLILNSLYDGILIINEDYIVKYINSSYTRITGVKRENIINRPLLEVRPGARLIDVIKTGKELLRVPRKEGNSEYVVNMSPIKDNQDDIIGAISIVTEINDVYKLTKELNKSNKIIKTLKNRVKSIQKSKYTFENIVSEDPKSKFTKGMAMKISKKDTNILLFGESGTGKELFAHSIHHESNRKDEPFIAVNCAAFDSNLLESELFGYEDASFTGAKKGGKMGLFEVANKGTLFLDEIAEMDYGLQAKLLRTLQENTIRRVGGVYEIPIDVRVIAATNKDLLNLIDENKFRKDLYYRIAIFPITISPLRERPQDIIPLTTIFLNNMQRKLKRRLEFSDTAKRLLLSYKWPGNIRELKNVVEFSSNMTNGSIIDINNLPKTLQQIGIKNDLISIRPLEKVIQDAEIREIDKALDKYGTSVEGKKLAAKSLGISLASLYNKLSNKNDYTNNSK